MARSPAARLQSAIGLTVTLVLQAGCAGQEVTNPTLEVELDIYSGLPNPRWRLSEAGSSDLLQRLDELEPCGPPPERPGLGYRGLAITRVGPPAVSPERIEVFRGVITIHREGEVTHYRDRRGIEEWLLRQAEARGHPTPRTAGPNPSLRRAVATR